MQYSPYDPWRNCAPVFGALSLAGGGAAALSGIGTAISAANTLAGGGYAAEHGQMQQNLADFEANQDIENAASTTASAQRQAIATSQQANLARSSAVAGAAAGGVNADTGSALVNQTRDGTVVGTEPRDQSHESGRRPRIYGRYRPAWRRRGTALV
jgi:uncharacterized protein HemX